MSHLQIIAALEELVERQAQIIRALSARLAQLGAADTGRDIIFGGGQPHNNMLPYLAVYVWQRTA